LTGAKKLHFFNCRYCGAALVMKAVQPDGIILKGLSFISALLIIEIIIFSCILHWPPSPKPQEKFDLLAVFGGDPDRVRLAIQLGQEGVGTAFVVSDSNSEQMKKYFQTFGMPGNAKIILEPYARTTDQNARMVSKIIRAQGFQKILLVTSWFHQPRAYLLLRLGLLGSGCDVRVKSSEPTPADFYFTPEFQMELFKFWGSLGRWTKSILRKNGCFPGETPLPVD
jgi:hypothetical protein